jgi:transposase
MKWLQNETLVRFSKRTDCCCEFGWNICNQTATSLGVSKAAVPKIVTAYTTHGKTKSADPNSGQKPKLSERGRHILKRIVSKNHRTAATKMTAVLTNHPEDVSTKNSLTRASQF